MRKGMMLLGVSMILVFGVFAQDWSTAKYKYDELYEGYVIKADGERLDGFIKYRNRSVMQDEVIFYKAKENPSSKIKFMPEDLSEYRVGDKTYHCINYSGGASVSTIKANLLINGEGCIKEYRWYDKASGYNTLIQAQGESDEDFGNRKFPPTTVYFKTGDQMAVTKSFFEDDFTKKMTEYVSDNKELAKKVKSKASGYEKILHLKAIFEEYNKGCTKK